MLKPHNHPVESHGRTALRNYIIQASTLAASSPCMSTFFALQ